MPKPTTEPPWPVTWSREVVETTAAFHALIAYSGSMESATAMKRNPQNYLAIVDRELAGTGSSKLPGIKSHPMNAVKKVVIGRWS